MERGYRSVRQASTRRANIVHLGQWTQLLRDAEYGRLPKVLVSLKLLPNSEVAAVGANVIVRGIERCTAAKLPILLDIIECVSERSSCIADGSTATMGCTTTLPLVRAAYHGLTVVVEALMAHGASVHRVAGHSASTMESALSAAVRTNKLNTLAVLLRDVPKMPAAHAAAAAAAAPPAGPAAERNPIVHGLVVQALWCAFEKQNVPTCHALTARGANIDDVFASILHVLESGKKFVRFGEMASATAPLVIGKPRPWHLPPAYVRGVVILHLCLQRAMDAPMPAEVFDHIVSFLPRDPTCFIDEATLRANLPWPREHNLFAIIARPRHRNGELVTCV